MLVHLMHAVLLLWLAMAPWQLLGLHTWPMCTQIIQTYFDYLLELPHYAAADAHLPALQISHVATRS